MMIRADDSAAIGKATKALSAGDLVVIPTETVYGLFADATNGAAVAKVFALKSRPRFNPLICHVGSRTMAAEQADFPPLALTLMEAFWPGALTLVLPRRAGSSVHQLVTAGLPTIALRHPRGIASDIISAFGKPLAGPSANPSGRLSPTRASHVARAFGSEVPLIIDAGPTQVGIESTIVAVTEETLTLLRLGGIDAAEIESVAGQALLTPASDAAVSAPGMLASHYAPGASVRLNAIRIDRGEALLAFGAGLPEGAENAHAIANLSADGDLLEAAANLFDCLDRLDRSGATVIAVAPIPDTGLGAAINDRLRRAAAPRKAQVCR